MADVTIDTVSMRQSIKQAKEKLEAVNKALEGLGTCIEELNDSWKGENHDEFVQSFVEEHERMQTLDAGVRAYLESLEDSAQEYDRCSDVLEDLVAKVRA